jgi:DNA-directed RNA polymerase subunit RPC12/RpoP
MHPRKPIKKPQANVQVDLREADTIKCDDCGNYLFITSFILKRLSAIVSPSGEEALVPVQVYSCGDCGKVPSKLLEGTGLEENPVPTLEIKE